MKFIFQGYEKNFKGKNGDNEDLEDEATIKYSDTPDYS